MFLVSFECPAEFDEMVRQTNETSGMRKENSDRFFVRKLDFKGRYNMSYFIGLRKKSGSPYANPNGEGHAPQVNYTTGSTECLVLQRGKIIPASCSLKFQYACESL
jgi:hypothetical protein